MRNEFEVVITIQLKDGKYKTFSSGEPSRKPEIRDIAKHTDDCLEKLSEQYPGSKVISISYLAQAFHRG